MARDAELDRLKAAQDRAFQSQQDAYSEQQSAWTKRRKAGDAMNVAFEAKQLAYEAQQTSWQHVKDIQNSNGSQIDSFKSQGDLAHRNMQDAFERANAAYSARDGAGAKSWSNQGKAYQAERNGYSARVRELIDEIKTAKAQHDPNQQAFQAAKAAFVAAKAKFVTAKAAHEQAVAKFRQAKADHEAAKDAFQGRLALVRSSWEGKNRSLAEKAGVPQQYHDALSVSRKPDGTVNIYFGGVGAPDGPGHGHYTLSVDGKVTYRRDPFDPHGSHNFEGPGKDGHKGGFGRSQHGWVDDHPVTFALGWGTRKGHTLLADGHLSPEQFRDSHNHDHYGPGDGPNNNGTLRRKYTGPGA